MWWMVAFGLKTIGAAWDASYHFKNLRDLTQLPHVVNALGLFLVMILWVRMWRGEVGRPRGAWRVIGAGIGWFFISIWIDDAYHRRFGIDLTTWSPAHFMLYAGTGIMLLGLLLQVRSDARLRLISKRVVFTLQIMLLIFIFDGFWFPLLQQEQGVIAYDMWQHGRTIAGPELLALLKNPYAQIYGGVPEWVYGVYASFSIAFIGVLASTLLHKRYAPLMIGSGYIAFRVLMNMIFAATTYPTSTIPYALLLAGWLWALIYSKQWPVAQSFKAAVGIVAITGSLYVMNVLPNTPPLHPPMPLSSLPLAASAAAAGMAVAKLLLRPVQPGAA